MGKSGKALLVAAALSGCLAAPGSASAAVNFGADLADPALTPDSSPFSCASFTVTQSDNTAETGSPISGVLVSARVRTAGAVASGFFRVLHPTGFIANAFWNEGEAPVPATSGADHVTEVLTRLRIAAGDRIAAAFPGFASYWHSDPEAVYRGRGEPPAHAVGNFEVYELGMGGCGPGSFEVLVQGTVELDADDDGFGDETQDQCPGSAGSANGCVPPTAATPVAKTATPVTKKCKKGFRAKKVRGKRKCVRKRKK